MNPRRLAVLYASMLTDVRLTGDLAGVALETMCPASVGVWLPEQAEVGA